MHHKKHATVVFAGHHGAGKSTTAGHLMLLQGGVDKRTFETVERETGLARPTCRYSWIMDNLPLERERCMTVQVKIRHFETPQYSCTVLDTPGHNDYLRNTITALSQADVVVLVVDGRLATLQDPERMAQIQDTATLACYLASRKLICAVNQLDHYFQNSTSEERFESAKQLLKRAFKAPKVVGDVTYVPISGYHGDNLTERGDNLDWYTGPTLVDAIDQHDLTADAHRIDHSTHQRDEPLRIPILDVFKVGGMGTILAGRLAGGCLTPGTTLSIQPAGLTAVVQSIEAHHSSLAEATAGDTVGICIKGLSTHAVRRGWVLSDAAHSPARPAASFRAKIYVFRDPRHNVLKAKRGLRLGYCPLVDIHTAHVPCRLTRIDRIDPKGNITEADVNVLHEKEGALVDFVPCKPLVVERPAAYPHMGRFVIRDVEFIIAVGVVLEVRYEEPPKPPGGREAGGQAPELVANDALQADGAGVQGSQPDIAGLPDAAKAPAQPTDVPPAPELGGCAADDT